MDTSISLLERLKGDPRHPDWDELVALYSPLIRRWLSPLMGKSSDVDDVVQDVLAVVIRHMPEFERQRTGSFRAWLKQITVLTCRDFWKAGRYRFTAKGGSDFQTVLNQLEDPNSDQSRIWVEQHDQHILAHVLQQAEKTFDQQSWTVFQQVALEGRNPADVANEAGLTVNHVYVLKSRVLSRIRSMSDRMLEND